MKQKRMKPEARKEDILTAALDLATKTHYTKVTKEQVAQKAGVSPSAIQYHFKTMARLRKQLIRAAVKRKCLTVIMQGYVARDAFVMRAPDGLLRQAVESVAV